MGRRRGGRAALALLFALAVLAGCGSPGTEWPPPGPLRILLVNDDGWNAPGIVALRDALRAAGHRVTVVAPTGPRNDAGTATTMSGDLVVRRPVPRDPDLRAVAGTPADATLVGLRAVLANDWPAVVISGINPEPTVGLSTMSSGQVGAAMTAAAISIPAISVSTQVADPRRPRREEFRATADFVVRLVVELQEKRTQLLLMPPRTVLNVNYPGDRRKPGEVTVAPTSPVPSTSMFYRVGSRPGTLAPAPVEREAPSGDNDVTAVRNGDVVLTDLSVDPDRSAPPARVAAGLAPGLTP